MQNNHGKLYVAMVGLPAMGKSTVALKLKENLEKEGVAVQVFNNGELRRRLIPDSAHAGFYAPENTGSAGLRENIARMNIEAAREYLAGVGRIAVLDATNLSRRRRRMIRELLPDHPVLFIECVNDDEDLLEASISRKARLPEFAQLSAEQAAASFRERIEYYRRIAAPLDEEEHFVVVDSLNNRILREKTTGHIPFWGRIRDLLVSDWVKNLYLVRHGESEFNRQGRIGGDSGLTVTGHEQAAALATHFSGLAIPYIFTSTRARTRQMAQPLARTQKHCTVTALPEFDEIDAGICEGKSYDEIRRSMPEEFAKRSEDKYSYVYPGGEGYATMRERVDRGVKKALYLSGNAENILIVGHQAINRMILSHFLFRRTEDVPYIFIPQDRYFHIVSTQHKKLFELKAFEGILGGPGALGAC